MVYQADELYESATEQRMADLFADAVARLEEGESINAILADLPPDLASDLRGTLLISESLLALQHAPLPARNSTRVRARRTEFLNQIALEQTRQEVVHPDVLPTTPTYAGYVQPLPSADPNAAGLQRLGARVPNAAIGPATRPAGRPAAPMPRSWLQRLADAFTIGRMRLMPLIITLTLALTAALGLARVTQASLPGDLTYPLKSWVKMMNLSLAAPEARATASQQAAELIQADIAASAVRAQERIGAGSRIVAPRESVSLIFDGYEGRLLKFGDIRVVPSWQPDPNQPATLPMNITGDLRPGALVWLTMQILPGQGDLVQGVNADVQEAPAGLPPIVSEPLPATDSTTGASTGAPDAAPAAAPKAGGDAAPTREGAEMLVLAAAEGATPVPCTPQVPTGWGIYTVVQGDHLTALARATGTTVREIAGANCLVSDVIVIGQTLAIPLSSDLPVASPAAPAEPNAAPASATEPAAP